LVRAHHGQVRESALNHGPGRIPESPRARPSPDEGSSTASRETSRNGTCLGMGPLLVESTYPRGPCSAAMLSRHAASFGLTSTG
jgi:hypothetical protein